MKSSILICYRNGDYAPLCVRLVEKGERYGRDFCLYHESDDPLVEFYDMRYAHTVYGEFVSRYCVSTIMESSGGLCLMGGTYEWAATEETMSRVREWIKSEEAV